MKNLLTFTDPLKRFVKDCEVLNKIQIDNGLGLGWKPEDIIMATNFPWEYRGVKSTIVGTYETFDNNRSTKIPIICELFEKGSINEKEVYWFHDDDALQLVPFTVELKKDAGFTTHGAYDPVLWNAGSFFFKKSAKDIFDKIYYYMNLHKSNEQNALTYIWKENIDGMKDRCEIMNQTYNIGIYKIDENIKMSELPIKVAHFHPNKKHHLELYTSRNLLSEKLLTIFKDYGII